VLVNSQHKENPSLRVWLRSGLDGHARGEDALPRQRLSST
jgi:hypothetical protein